jgi:hypothetical protein
MSASMDLVCERWPALHAELAGADTSGAEVLAPHGTATLRVDGRLVASARDRVDEGRTQAALIDERAAEATVYGLGLGDLQREVLGRAALERLRVVVLARRIARASLEAFDHTDWLRDPRVELVLARDAPELAKPFAASPTSLKLADDDALRLRDLVVLELAGPYLEEAMAEREQVLADHVARNRAALETDGDAAELFGTERGRTILVAAAGPTLAGHLDVLREHAAPLIAVDAAVRTLLDAGVTPDVVVTVDTKPHGVVPHFDRDLDALAESVLVYLPVSPPAALELWPGRRLAAYAHHPRYAELARELPRARLYCSGTVFHAAVDLAVRMGARRVVLLGADFAFPGGMSHAAGAAQAAEVGATGTWVLDGRGDRVATRPNLAGYLRDFERYVAIARGVEFANASQDGAAIEGAPFDARWADALREEAARVR